MGGDFPNAFIPAVHPLFPKAGSTGQSPHWLPGDGEPSSGRGLFSPGWRWDGAAAMVLVFGQLQTVSMPSLQGLHPTLAVLLSLT